ncbi:MAG: type II secretion system F family protein [Nanopusillaceae archaeon]|jgi:pilus assembly protein TadC
MIRKETLLNVENSIEKIKRYTNKLEKIIKEIKRKKEWIKYFEKLYLEGYLDKKEFERRKKIIENRINFLESKKYSYLYDLISIIEETEKSIRFLEGIEEKSEEENKYIQSFQYRLDENMNKIQKIFPEVFNKEEIKLERKFFEAENILFKRKDKEEKEERKININKIIKKKGINYYEEIKKIFINISYKIFGNISKKILNLSPKIYFQLKSMLKESYYDISPEEFLSSSIFISILLFLIIIFLSIYLYNFYYFLYGIIVFSLTIFSIFYYFQERKKNIRENIEKNLPFAIIHMASLASAGIEIKYIFKIISETDEYGFLSKEFKKILDRIDLGESLTDALRSVASETVSKDLRDFLEELILTIESGRKISEFLLLYSQQEMMKYNSFLKKIGQVMKTFSDLYVGMVLTLPMIIISIGIMLMSILQQTYNVNIQGILEIVTYVVLPLINLGFIFVFNNLSKE